MIQIAYAPVNTITPTPNDQLTNLLTVVAIIVIILSLIGFLNKKRKQK